MYTCIRCVPTVNWACKTMPGSPAPVKLLFKHLLQTELERGKCDEKKTKEFVLPLVTIVDDSVQKMLGRLNVLMLLSFCSLKQDVEGPDTD